MVVYLSGLKGMVLRLRGGSKEAGAERMAHVGYHGANDSF